MFPSSDNPFVFVFLCGLALVLLSPTAFAQDEPDCDALVAEYLSVRAELNHCQGHSVCAEIWPGLCPHGPYYIHFESDLSELNDLLNRIDAVCILPECEAPEQLGMAACFQGRCVPGRPPAIIEDPDEESCWDFPITYVENGQTVFSMTQTYREAVVGFGAPAAGSFQITVSFERDDGLPAVATHHGLIYQRLCED